MDQDAIKLDCKRPTREALSFDIALAGRTGRSLLIVGLSCLLLACATGEQARFRMALDNTLDASLLSLPAPSTGQESRYFYLGELVGEPNFVKTQPASGSLQSFLSALSGLLTGDSAPRVMDRPQSGAVDREGRIFVTDIGRGGIYVFDETRAQLDFWTQAEERTPFVTPVGVAIGPNGEIFVADAELGFIARLDARGSPLVSIGKGQLNRPTGISYEASTRRLFVTDTPAHQVKVFDLQGQLLSSIGQFGEGVADLNYPTHLTVNEGELYVSDTLNARIQVYSTQSGKHLRQIGKRGLFVGDLVRPKGLATDSEHNIYIIESNHDHLLVYNRKGEFLMPIRGGGGGNFYLPSGVWVDSKNRVFVADTLNNRVAVFQFLGGTKGNANE